MAKRWLILAMLAAAALQPVPGLERPDVTFKVFQFPPNMIPRIDGNTDDWAMVPDSYAIGMDQLMDTGRGHGMNHDPKKLDVKVKVGWVRGLNRLYFLYEAYDNYWDFARTDLHNDIFEMAELSHLHASRRQGLGYGVGLRAVYQGAALRQRRL